MDVPPRRRVCADARRAQRSLVVDLLQSPYRVTNTAHATVPAAALGHLGRGSLRRAGDDLVVADREQLVPMGDESGVRTVRDRGSAAGASDVAAIQLRCQFVVPRAVHVGRVNTAIGATASRAGTAGAVSGRRGARASRSRIA